MTHESVIGHGININYTITTRY